MMSVTVRSSKWDDVKHIALNMRESDRLELSAAGINTPSGALVKGMRESSICFSIADEKLGPVAMFGVVGNIEEPAGVWLLGTDGVSKIGKTFMKIARDFIKAFLVVHPELSNYVDVDNVRTIKWLKKLGASFDKPKIYGLKNNLFCRFTFRREAHV